MGEDLILVVDDDLPTLRLIEKILRSKGYRIHMARNEAEGIAALSLQPALVLLDVHLPRRYAVQFAAHLHQLAHPPLLVVMSADHETRPWAEEIGALAFLPKPMSFTDLLTTVRLIYQHTAPPPVTPEDAG